MSVESKTIVMLAYDIGKKGWDEIEKVDESLQDSDTLVIDGMCGNYYYFGIVLSELDEDTTFKLSDLTEEKLRQLQDELMADLNKIGEIVGVTAGDLILTVFNHYY